MPSESVSPSTKSVVPPIQSPHTSNTASPSQTPAQSKLLEVQASQTVWIV